MIMNSELDALLGRRVILGFQGTEPTDPEPQALAELFRRRAVGGVLLYGRNIVSPEQTARLCNFFWESHPDPKGAVSYGVPTAPLIFVDQEGGKVQRLVASKGFLGFAAAEDIANSMSPAEAESFYAKLAQEARSVGFSGVFAPCVDLKGNPGCSIIGPLGRSFGSDPAVVAAYGAAVLKGFRSAGVIGSAKHFPGHGLCGGDTHEQLVDITESFQDAELEPYRMLVREGAIDIVMSAHVRHNGIDPVEPVTFSKRWLQEILRGEIGFKGVIVADDLHMGALQRNYTLEQTVVKALQAGGDLLMFSNNPLALKDVERSEDQRVKELAASKTGYSETGGSRLDKFASGDVPGVAIVEQVVAIIKRALAAGELSEQSLIESDGRVQQLQADCMSWRAKLC